MNVTINSLIGRLPPYLDQWEVIHPNQTVKDIMREVLEAHKEFAPYYDEIALCFDDRNTEGICNKIYFFLKDNIKYQEETEADQTSALPTGILTRRHGDCKHYSSFAGGILDAMNRAGKKIKWCYVFASYKILDDTPHHVFIEVENEKGQKLWIDPTPGSDNKDPAWVIRKKIKSDTMALRRNIAGFTDGPYSGTYIDFEDTIGTTRPFWQLMPVEGVRGKDGQHGTNPYFSGPFLALQHYLEDPYSVEGTNWDTTAQAINAAIAKGPAPGHTVNADFTKWIYDKSMKGWNFYYPMGVQENYVPDLPAWYPHLLIDQDGKLVFDRVYKVDDYMNDEIHALTAWAQSIINDKSAAPFPLTPRQVKLYSQGNAGDSLFTEDRGQGFLADVFDFTKKILLFAPRNAFLSLVGINAFGMASKLKNAIYDDKGQPDADGYPKIMSRWESLGGQSDKLENTINDGASKTAILGGRVINGPEIPAWVATASAIIAAIMPLVDAILKSKKDSTGIDYTIDPKTGLPYPPITTGAGSGGAGGDIIQTIKDNPLPAVALGLGAFLMLTKKKKVAGIGENILPLALIGYGVYYFFFRKKAGEVQTQPPTVAQMRTILTNVSLGDKAWVDIINNKMTDQEIKDSYTWLYDYVIPNKKDQAPADLKSRIADISAKYNIFT